MILSPKRGWGLVTTTGILTGFGHGFVAFAVSALLKPIAIDLDTSRGAVSTAIGLGRLAAGVTSPLVGRIADRSGPRLVVAFGMVLTALGLVTLGLVETEISLYLAWSILISVGVAAGFTVALDKVIVGTIKEGRGMALAVRFSVAAVVSTLLVPFVTILVELLGWRTACFIWAGVVLCLVPIPLLVFERPTPSEFDRRSLPDLEQFRTVIARPVFWLIAFAFMAQASVVTGASVHLVPLMTDNGLSAPMAGTIFGGMILLSIPTRLLAGQVADKARIGRLPLLMAGLLVFEAVAFISFVIAPSFSTMLAVVLALGIGAGAPTIVVLLLCAHLFGEQKFASVQGSLMFLQVPGTMLAPIVAGLTHDWFGSYQMAIALFAAMLVMAATAMGAVRIPRA